MRNGHAIFFSISPLVYSGPLSVMVAIPFPILSNVYDLILRFVDPEFCWETMQRMRTKGVRRMPVINEPGGLEGILTVDDLLELLAEELILLAKLPTRE